MESSPTKKALLALRQMQSKLDAPEQLKHEPIAVVGIGGMANKVQKSFGSCYRLVEMPLVLLQMDARMEKPI